MHFTPDLLVPSPQVSELLEIIRQSGLPAPRVLRGQAVLQRLAETVGELRRSLAIAKARPAHACGVGRGGPIPPKPNPATHVHTCH